MTREKSHWCKSVGTLIVYLAIQSTNLTTAAIAAQQTPEPIQISGPANGSVVHPGQVVTVTVTSPANVTLTNVFVMGGGDFRNVVPVTTSLPAELSWTIPPTSEPRKYAISASGETASGDFVDAAILLNLERPDVPYAISTPLPQITFPAQGDEYPITLLGTFGDGTSADITTSANVVYSSSDTAVATVNSDGRVRAIGPGRAVITGTYGEPGGDPRIAIPVRVLATMFTMVPKLLSFGDQVVGTSSQLSFTVTNSSAAPVGIVSVGTTGDFAETNNCISRSPLAVAASCTVTVSFQPTSEGMKYGRINLDSGSTDPVVYYVGGIGR